jgi:WD40 repeat protein
VAWRPCGLGLATGCSDRLARIYSLSGGIPEPDVRLCHRGEVRSVAWRSDGRKLATGSHDRCARIFDALGTEELVLPHGDSVASVSWMPPQGDKLATGCLDKLARVFDADTGKELVKMRHSNPVACVSWEPGVAGIE